MKIILASRKSDLARLQTYRVAAALKKVQPEISIEFQFRESLGDKNLTTPLWKIPERGVFTEDFVSELREGKVDLVVHSWKDLPTEDRQGISVLATLPRADCRDLLLVRKSFTGSKMKILTSSPRRTYSLQRFLKDLVPYSLSEISCESVRGNIPTRIQKLANGEGDALMVAKAALDRLLSAEEEEFAPVQNQIRTYLDEMNWMVLPLSLFPTAPAQGAIAIEGLKSREDLKKILAQVHCSATAKAVNAERKRFSAFGGGCHQKIGLTIVPHPQFGSLEYFSGELDSGEQVHQIQTEISSVKKNKNSWPDSPISFFERHEISTKNPQTPLYIARAEALPQSWSINQLVWCAGLDSWKKLARRKIWVNGCSEGLGEELPEINALVRTPLKWTKLSHNRSKNTDLFPVLATYELNEIPMEIPLAEEFFWMSASAFQRALELQPKIRHAHHAAGPGYTAKFIEKELGKPVSIYLSFKHWKTGKPL